MSFILDIQINDIEILVDSAVYQMVDCHNNKDDEGFKKAFEDWKISSQRRDVGERMRRNNLEEWDWKWAAETGNLCNYDWKLFGEEMIKSGVDKDAYDKKWKFEPNGMALDSRSRIP